MCLSPRLGGWGTLIRTRDSGRNLSCMQRRGKDEEGEGEEAEEEEKEMKTGRAKRERVGRGGV